MLYCKRYSYIFTNYHLALLISCANEHLATTSSFLGRVARQIPGFTAARASAAAVCRHLALLIRAKKLPTNICRQLPIAPFRAKYLVPFRNCVLHNLIQRRGAVDVLRTIAVAPLGFLARAMSQAEMLAFPFGECRVIGAKILLRYRAVESQEGSNTMFEPVRVETWMSNLARFRLFP